MFDRFDRYIARNVLWAMLIVQITLLSLDFLLSFISELGSANKAYGPLQMLIYQGMRLPWRFYGYIPVGVLLGGLLGLGGMASSNELTAIRAAGRSLARIVWGAMKPLLLVIGITMALGEWVVPVSEQSATAYRLERLRGITEMSQSGGWQTEGSDIYRFGTIRSDNTVLDITRFIFDGHTLNSVMHADSASWNATQQQWTLHGVKQTALGSEQVTTSSADAERWETSFSPEFLTLVLMDPETQSIADLWRYGRYLDAQNTDSHAAWLNFWQKSLQPLALAGLLLVAASFVFGPLRTVAAGTRIFYGIVAGLIFKYTQDLLAPSSVLFHFSPLWAVLVPIVACWLLGILLLRKRG